MTDNELQRLLQEKFKFHELDLPVNGWDAIEKRLPVIPRRVTILWKWSAAIGIAATVLIAIILFNTPSNLVPSSPILSESSNTQATSTKQVHTPEHTLLAKVEKKTESKKDINKTEKKSTDKASKKRTKAEEKSDNEDENSANTKETESIETTPKEDNNQQPSLHEQEDDGAEYIVQLDTVKQPINSNNTIDNQSFVAQKNPTLSIEEAEQLMKEQNKKQLASITEPDKSVPESESNTWNVGLLASLTPDIQTMSTVPPTILMDNTFSYRSMTRINARHDLPIMVGASVGIPFTKRLLLQTGLNYSYVHSVITKENSITGNYAKDNQRLHYLGIPVMLSYRIINHKIVQFYVSGGGMAEKGLVKDVITQNFDTGDNLINTESKQEAIKGLQWSLTANVGLGITLYKGLHLFFEPGFTWCIPNQESPQPENIRTERPYNLSLTAGIRYNLDR